MIFQVGQSGAVNVRPHIPDILERRQSNGLWNDCQSIECLLCTQPLSDFDGDFLTRHAKNSVYFSVLKLLELNHFQMRIILVTVATYIQPGALWLPHLACPKSLVLRTVPGLLC